MRKLASFKGSLELKFFEQQKFESLKHKSLIEQNAIIGRNALRLLMMGWPEESWTQLLSWPVFKAVFIQRDAALLKEFRLAFQQGFEHVFLQLKDQSLTSEQQEQAELYISNCLCLLPYSDLTPYESVKIPQCLLGVWTLVEYYVQPIELTDSSRPDLEDKDRVFAYGLEPIQNTIAQAHLIFMGTTYPAGQGFVPQIYTDFKAFETVGSSLYQSGRAKVLDWLQNQKEKVHVCGVSLGGALSLLLAIDLGEYLSRVDALNPPGLYEAETKNSFDCWNELQSKPQVVVQQQANDPVSQLGVWKADWELIHVIPPKEKQGPNPFCDHFLNYAGFSQTEFIYTSPEEENLKRKHRNFFFYSLGRSTVYYLAIIPYMHLIRPVLYFLVNNHTSLAFAIAALSAITGLTAILFAAVVPAFVLISAAVIFSLSSAYLFVSKCFASISTNSINKDKTFSAMLHHPSLPRNSSLDIYNKLYPVEVTFPLKKVCTYNKISYLFGQQQTKVTDSGCYSPEEEEAEVTICTTKAKVVHMRRVLTIFERTGDPHNPVLINEFAAYQQGLFASEF